MKIQLVKSISGVELLALSVFEGDKNVPYSSLGTQFLKENPKFGKFYETQLLFDGKQKILLVGCGKKEKWDFGKLQNFIGVATKFALSKVKKLSINLEKASLKSEQVGEAVSLGVELAVHDPARDYKSEKEPVKLEAVEVLLEDDEKAYQEGLDKGLVLAKGINLVRKLGDMPANEMTPDFFLSHVKAVAKNNGLKLTVFDEAQAKKKGMGAFVGVAQGSEEPSYMIVLEYFGDPKSKDIWGLCGKGITFDSGGISIKPSSAMHEMKYDMCGAATVLAVVEVLAKLKVKNNVVGVMAVTENLPGGRAQRPGDIVKMYSGKTAEILNTDAEGRLVLADALALAQKDYKANKLIDIATLTGAVVVALAGVATGVLGNNQVLIDEVISQGAKVGEKYWQLPMFEEYDEAIKSEIADMVNTSSGGPSWVSGGGVITAAKFLEQAVEKNKVWVHLDIAGTAWDLKSKPYRAAGATGVGVKTLVELLS